MKSNATPAPARNRRVAFRRRLKVAATSDLTPRQKLARRDPYAIAFEGEVVRLLPQGRRQVRLDNGHVVTVLASLGTQTDVSLIGDRVVVEIAFNQLKGWRLARRP